MSRISVILAAFACVFSLLANRALSQCLQPTKGELASLVGIVIRQRGTEGGPTIVVDIKDLNFNCLAAEPKRGYDEAIVTANYTANSGDPEQEQFRLVCFGTSWSIVQWFLLPREIGDELLTAEDLLNSPTDTNCLDCYGVKMDSAPTGSHQIFS